MKTISLLLLLWLPLASCSREPAFKIGSSTFLGTFSPSEIERLCAPLFESLPRPPIERSVDHWKITFSSTDFDGASAPITAQVFVPRYDAATERPVIVFGSGTTGISDACAPSLEQPEVRRWGYYRENMMAYAGMGFITIFPDYLGFNDPDRPQRYFSKLAEGRTMLDAARAVYSFMEAGSFVVRPARKVFVSGYSQGGHAAFAAADLCPEYAPDISLVGVIGFGSTTDVATLLREGPVYAPFIIYTFSVMYPNDVDPGSILQKRWADTLKDDAARQCVDEFQAYYPTDSRKLYTPEFHAALFEGTLSQSFPAAAKRLEENATGLSGHGLPALIVQGMDDIVVTPLAQDRFVRAVRGKGSPVRYLLLEGIRHRYSRPAGFAASVDWMELIADGDTPPSDGRSTDATRP